MADMAWWDAILAILKDSNEAKHYTEIADEIIDRGLRSSVGATPASTVNAYISESIAQNGEHSPFERTARGYYRLRNIGQAASASVEPHKTEASNGEEISEAVAAKLSTEATQEATGLINALGMYWSRDKINWSLGTPKLFGRQNIGSQDVDFSDQRGVYLLYDRSEPIYVGRAIDQGIGTRLKQHTFDRLNGRWDRFSWFGVYRVTGSGGLDKAEPAYDSTLLIATMEALLIESVEPSQNRKRGDEFRAVEFLQAEDPEVAAIRRKVLISELMAKL